MEKVNRKMNSTKYDEQIARSIQDEINSVGITENAVFSESGKENYRPRTLVDETLEYIDPTPNIYTLFVQFNEKFFWNVLIPVQVKWSPRMTSCAGICSFHPRNKECVISLSTPLLKLRPRKDLIETLLHEMIHAYLFLTNNNRDRDGHGPVFKSHMKRINKLAGTNITIYHSFHEEVKLYQQHWWRCNGPCHKRAPFFGTVRRAMNRAPGPNDFWWKDHQLNCSGQFIKIKEPPKPEKFKKPQKTATKMYKTNSITNWMKKDDKNNENIKNKTAPKILSQPKIMNWRNTKRNDNVKNKTAPKISNQSKIMDWKKTKINSISNFKTDMKKLGNGTNNVHGWGTGGPSSSSDSSESSPTRDHVTSNNSLKSSGPSFSFSGVVGAVGAQLAFSGIVGSSGSRLSFSGVLGGAGTGRSVLLDRYCTTDATSSSSKQNSPVETNLNQVNSINKPMENSNMDQYLETVEGQVMCPNCNEPVDESEINQHLDSCLEVTRISENTSDNSNRKRKIDNDCTSSKVFKNNNESSSEQVQCPVCENIVNVNIFYDHIDNCLQKDADEMDDILIEDSSSSSINSVNSPHTCLICDKLLKPNVSLSDHLEECVASVFNDSTANDTNTNDCTTDVDLNESTIEEETVLDEFPCPVCMALIKESLMNEHLDICLNKVE